MSKIIRILLLITFIALVNCTTNHKSVFANLVKPFNHSQLSASTTNNANLLCGACNSQQQQQQQCQQQQQHQQYQQQQHQHQPQYQQPQYQQYQQQQQPQQQEAQCPKKKCIPEYVCKKCITTNYIPKTVTKWQPKTEMQCKNETKYIPCIQVRYKPVQQTKCDLIQKCEKVKQTCLEPVEKISYEYEKIEDDSKYSKYENKCDGKPDKKPNNKNDCKYDKKYDNKLEKRTCNCC